MTKKDLCTYQGKQVKEKMTDCKKKFVRYKEGAEIYSMLFLWKRIWSMKILIGIVVTMIVLCLWYCVVAGIAADIEIQEMTDKNKQEDAESEGDEKISQ